MNLCSPVYWETKASSRSEERFGDAYVYIKPGTTWAALADYDNIIVDRVKIILPDHAELQRTNADQVKKSADYFHQAIKREITRGDNDYRIVAAPGPGTLRFRVAIVAGEPKSPDFKPVDLIPLKLLFGAAVSIKDNVKDLEDVVLELWLEAEIIDASTGERLFAVTDSHDGEKQKVGKGEQLTWEASKAVFDFWAKNLRGRLDKARGK